MQLLKSLTLALILLCSLALTAPASTIDPFPIIGLVFDGDDPIIKEFTVPDDGYYKAVIEDLMAPEPFAELVFAILNKQSTGYEVEGIADEGAGSMDMFTFVGDSNDIYVAVIGGRTGESGKGLFLAEVSHVPIPPSLLLLGSGLVSLVILRRRRS